MEARERAAERAVDFVKNGMTIGLGTGSTAEAFVKFLAEKAKRRKWKLKCVCTSKRTERLAKSLGLKVVGLDAVEKIDVAVDGADLVDERSNLIKGGGGAHAREKVVDYSAKKFVVIVDESKLSKKLHGRVPLEVLPFAFPFVKKEIEKKFKARVELRKKGGKIWVSDNGNLIADAFFAEISEPRKIEGALNNVPGVVENGVFSRNVSRVIVGTETGVRVVGK